MTIRRHSTARMSPIHNHAWYLRAGAIALRSPRPRRPVLRATPLHESDARAATLVLSTLLLQCFDPKALSLIDTEGSVCEPAHSQTPRAGHRAAGAGS